MYRFSRLEAQCGGTIFELLGYMWLPMRFTWDTLGYVPLQPLFPQELGRRRTAAALRATELAYF
jgi:hypothetical protein